MSSYKIEAGTAQHIGDRKEQQDRVALFAAPNAPGYMMAVVADGMGGKSGGALAAEQVVRTSKTIFDDFFPENDIKVLLQTIVLEANTVIRLAGISAEKEPHSTLAILVLTPEKKAFWAHVGDTRVYRFSGPNFAERTRDHSYVEKLIEDGQISEDQSRSHKMSNVLINIIGSKTPPYISFGSYEQLSHGDSFLLCTDGLWPFFTDAELSAAVAANTPRQAADLLIRKAREKASGHGDNCSFAIVKLVKPAPEVKTYTVNKMRRAI